MTNHEGEPGFELVLDNRKLIIAFAVIIAFCGCFFVEGFRIGKRQGLQEATQTAAESQSKVGPDSTQAQTGGPSDERSESPKEGSADQQLNWYKSVNKPDGAETAATAAGRPAALKPPEQAEKTKAPAPARLAPDEPKPKADTGPVTYSVQVGAFRQLHELEVRAKILREKGFECRTEPPQIPGDFYLLKVGRFNSRAEAVAMRLRLKESGISSFVKTNK